VKVNNVFPYDFVLILKRVRQITTIIFVMSVRKEIRRSPTLTDFNEFDITVHFQKQSRFFPMASE